MKFIELSLSGSYLIELTEFFDERGSFARQFCKKEFAKRGIELDICQCNISKNTHPQVLRGLHFQKAPYLEPKLVSCLKGSFLDVIVDLRPESPTYLKHEKIKLSEQIPSLLYIPPSFAHGFLTLEANTTVFYQLGNYFEPNYYDGLRYNDPKLGIDWGNTSQIIINERDANYAYL
ncbi:MAG: dTDP-4-keto-6-deoxy-D-glucose epimerase [Vampirovibrio sp.]